MANVNLYQTFTTNHVKKKWVEYMIAQENIFTVQLNDTSVE